MLLSILIPCQEDGFLLFPTIKSIFQNEFPTKEFEIILLHNNTVQISKNVDKFHVRKYSDAFMNQAQALNWGLEKACGEIICITKPGCIVDSNWLAEIKEFFHRHSDVDGIGGPVFPCWEYGTEIQKLASQIFHEEQGFPNSIVTLHLNDFRGLFHATNSAFRKEVFESVRFDETFCYDYDFDICFKMIRMKLGLAYNPAMKVQYIFPSSLSSLLKRYYTWGKENVILQKKYFSPMRFKEHLYQPYNTIRSFLQPPSFISRKKLLTLVQHIAFNFGRMSFITAA